MSTNKLKIAVTGANGSIGRGVVSHALDEGHTVVALDVAHQAQHTPEATAAVEDRADRFSYKAVDLTDEAAFRDAIKGCDALIHLAAVYSLQNPKDPDGPLLRYEPEEVGRKEGCGGGNGWGEGKERLTGRTCITSTLR